MSSVNSEPQVQNGADQDKRLQCKTCNRLFTRSEHLKRHELIHSDDKPYQCNICDRSFVRKDALDRHVTVHKSSGPTLRQKGARACSNCAVSKVRCSGELPVCSRCQKRNKTQCIYPDLPTLSNEDNPDQAGFVPSPNLDMAMSVATGRTASIVSRGEHASNSNLDATLQTPAPGIVPQNTFDQTYWEHEFQSTINWLSNDAQMFSNDFGQNEWDDNTFFPFLSLPVESNIDTQSPVVQNTGLASPVHFFGQRTVAASPQHASNVSLSSAETPRSTGTQPIRQHVEGELYVDGQPARLPRVKRRKLTASSVVTTPSRIDSYSLRCEATDFPEDAMDLRISLSDQVYDQMVNAFNAVCLDKHNGGSAQHGQQNIDHMPHLRMSFFPRFEPEFPSKTVFELLVSSYITSFHPTLPIFHPLAFSSLEWHLILTISAIGARFVNTPGCSALFAASLHEFVRRMAYLSEGDETWLPNSPTSRAQMQLLHAVDVAYRLPLQSRQGRHPIEALPTQFCLVQWAGSRSVDQRQEQPAGSWEEWIKIETRNRLGHAIWLLDCMFAVHFQRRPLLTLDDSLACLPCHEDVWQAESADEWRTLQTGFPSDETLSDALHQIYIQKRVSPHVGEFSRVLLIHGLFHRMWQVEAYLKQPLSQWTPTAPRATNPPQPMNSPAWLPLVPTFSKWRNATCDCIDVLHWSANATIGAASGMEHPTVLHLHFSRVVLLTPYKHIVAFAKHLAGVEATPMEAAAASDRQAIRRWALQDQYKARLAMIHAAVLFWHVRRYSVNGFYEPNSVAISALSLWAFSAFSDRPQKSKQGRTTDSVAMDADDDGSDMEEARCDIILLDRPTDDELVQQYVREGHQMRAILNGVGDLCGPNGPERVLIEARKMLRTLTLWGVAEHWITMFDKLIAVSRRQRQHLNNGEKT